MKLTFLFKCSELCCLLLHLVQKAKFLCSSNVKAGNSQMSVFFRGVGSMRRSQNLEVSVKKYFMRHFARFNLSRLSLAFISKYYPVLHVVKR